MPAGTPQKFLNGSDTVALISCPFSGGQPRPGVDKGAISLLDAGLEDQIKELGWKVEATAHDFNSLAPADDPPIGIVKQPRFVSSVCKQVAEQIKGHVEKGHLPVTLGGDHSLGIATVHGIFSKFPNACLFWIDAHADINTVVSTGSGNLHGMPVSFLLGHKENDLTSYSTTPEELHMFDWINDKDGKPPLQPNKIVYIGLRDVDPGEKRLLKEMGIKAFSMHEVDRYGIGKIVELALDHVNPNRDLPIHLTFDVDALDPSVAPSTGTPVRGGLTFREGHYICEALHETGLLVGVDIMEVNPSLLGPGDVAQTVTVGCSLTRAALGETLL